VPVTSSGRAAAAILLVLLLAGCGPSGSSKTSQPGLAQAAVPARSGERLPAAAAGGACQLLDFFAVEELIGVQFDVAASAAKEATATCVLRHAATVFPDLTLASTPTTATADSFRATGVPPGAVPISDVGVVAYQLVRPAPAGGDPAGPGPALEIGWLSKDGRLMVVRFRFGADAQQAAADALAPRLAELAKFLDG
jgi:hypothetical protein